MFSIQATNKYNKEKNKYINKYLFIFIFFFIFILCFQAYVMANEMSEVCTASLPLSFMRSGQHTSVLAHSPHTYLRHFQLSGLLSAGDSRSHAPLSENLGALVCHSFPHLFPDTDPTDKRSVAHYTMSEWPSAHCSHSTSHAARLAIWRHHSITTLKQQRPSPGVYHTGYIR